jgi:hypothetical protein
MGGSGSNWTHAWFGLPLGTCQRVASSSPSCFLSHAGEFAVQVRLRDTNGLSSESPALYFQVYPSPTAGTPNVGRPTVDVGQTVRFVEIPINQGSGTRSIEWTGLASGTCDGLTKAYANCTFASPTNLTVQAVIGDTNGEVATSPPLALSVSPRLVVPAPTANRTGADVGQSVLFSTVPIGGAGEYSFQWSGLPGTCVDVNSSTPSCLMTTPTQATVVVRASDASEEWSSYSDATSMEVYPEPIIGTPALSTPAVLLGGSVTISVFVTGGQGPYRYSWLGLPSGCSTVSSMLSCRPTQTGIFQISVVAQDADGYQVASPSSPLMVEPNTAAPSVSWLSPPLVYGVAFDTAATAICVGILVRRRESRVSQAFATARP